MAAAAARRLLLRIPSLLRPRPITCRCGASLSARRLLSTSTLHSQPSSSPSTPSFTIPPALSTPLSHPASPSPPPIPTTPLSSVPHPLRAHLCRELPPLLPPSSPSPPSPPTVSLCGWLQSIRCIGDLFFAVLRDHTGTIQLVWTRAEAATSPTPLFPSLSSLTCESVVAVKGHLRTRPPTTGMTGHLEVALTELYVLSHAAPLPFALYPPLPSLDVRLTHRHLDLRRPYLQRLLRLRSALTLSLRTHLSRHRFIEVETPLLFLSSPEGAREFLVPTRTEGQWYGLPQSPQQMKQVLMVGGIDRYYQIAKCFRDEGQRADRQPEFTQIDIECSFMGEREVRQMVEGVLRQVMRDEVGWDGQGEWQVMTYQHAMDVYGVDKPDLRFELLIQDLRGLIPEGSTVGREVLIRAIRVPGLSPHLSRREMDGLQAAHAGVTFVRVPSEGTAAAQWKVPPPLRSILQSGEGDKFVQRMRREMGVEEGDVLAVGMGQGWRALCDRMGVVRLALKDLLIERGLMELRADDLRFLWVVDFPLLDLDIDTVEAQMRTEGGDGVITRAKAQLTAMHHPFSAPHPDDADRLTSLLSPLTSLSPSAPLPLSTLHSLSHIRGQHYDVVCNGIELAGGSIRIHSASLQTAVLQVLGSDLSSFQGLLKALEHGAPPHGGIALGLDRFVAMMGAYVECKEGRGEEEERKRGECLPIRDVIAFPKTATGRDLMFGSPTSVSAQQLMEYHCMGAGKKASG